MPYLSLSGTPSISPARPPTGEPDVDTSYLQDMLNRAQVGSGMVVVPPGVWRISRPLVFEFKKAKSIGFIMSGYGPGTSRLVNETGGREILRIRQSGDYKYSWNIRLNDLGFSGPASGGTSELGVTVRGAMILHISNCSFKKFPEFGLHIDYTAYDPTASAHVKIDSCKFAQCNKRAIVCAPKSDPSFGAAVPSLVVQNCFFDRCGGCYYGGLTNGGFMGCTLAYSQTKPQIEIMTGVARSRSFRIDGCFFEGGEHGDISLGETYCGEIRNCIFAGTYLNTPTSSYGIRIGDGGSEDCQNLRIDGCVFAVNRYDQGMADYIAYDITSASYNTIIGRTFWQWFHPNYIKYNDNGTNTTIT